MLLRLGVGVTLDYWWLFWLRIEVTLWVIISFIFKIINNLQRFIFWQTLGSLFFIILFILVKSKLWIIAVLFKISLPPFHLWFIIYVKKVTWTFFLLFIYISKFPYIYILANLWCEMFSWFLVIFPLLTYIYFWACINFKYLLWVISIAEYPWRYFRSKRAYLLIIYLFLIMLRIVILINSNLPQIFMLLIFYIIGLPPFRLFHVKILIISCIFQYKICCFIIFSIRNRIFFWLIIFLKWFIIELKLRINSNIVKILFIILNFAWLIF